MRDLIKLILVDYRNAGTECLRRLEYEESTNVLAKLQGELSASKLFLDSFENNFSSNMQYETISYEFEKVPDFKKVTDKHIALLESQRIKLESDESWEVLLQVIDAEIDKKKEWLFSCAEKGRDLIYTHGWRDCLTRHTHLCNQIECQYEWRLEHNQLFAEDFDLDNVEESEDFQVLELMAPEPEALPAPEDADTEVIE